MPTSAVGTARGCSNISCPNTVYFADAVAKAKSADVTVLVLGLYTGCHGDDACESEGWDRTSIALPGKQADLLAAVKPAAKKLVCVLVHGGGLQLAAVMAQCDAVVDAWYPGSEGGNGLADVFFGKVHVGSVCNSMLQAAHVLGPGSETWAGAYRVSSAEIASLSVR
jgi:beta-glucosidase